MDVNDVWNLFLGILYTTYYFIMYFNVVNIPIVSVRKSEEKLSLNAFIDAEIVSIITFCYVLN